MVANERQTLCTFNVGRFPTCPLPRTEGLKFLWAKPNAMDHLLFQDGDLPSINVGRGFEDLTVAGLARSDTGQNGNMDRINKIDKMKCKREKEQNLVNLVNPV